MSKKAKYSLSCTTASCSCKGVAVSLCETELSERDNLFCKDCKQALSISFIEDRELEKAREAPERRPDPVETLTKEIQKLTAAMSTRSLQDAGVQPIKGIMTFDPSKSQADRNRELLYEVTAKLVEKISREFMSRVESFLCDGNRLIPSSYDYYALENYTRGMLESVMKYGNSQVVISLPELLQLLRDHKH